MSEVRPATLAISRTRLLFALAAIGFVLVFGTVWSAGADPIDNEFINLYASSHFMGSDRVYDADAIRAVVNPLGKVMPARTAAFLRMPYVLFLTWPLKFLSVSSAFLAWRLLQCACVLVFALAWSSRRDITMLAVGWSLPVAWAVVSGNDVASMLLFLAALVALERRGQDFLAGAALSLCAIKPHLVIFVPVVILAQRKYRMLLGGIAGSTLLVVLSFVACGKHWPAKYLHSITSNEIHPFVDCMPGVRWLLDVPGGIAIIGLLAGVAAVLVWYIARRASFATAASVALCAGMLVNLHSYSIDCLLLLPVVIELLKASPVASRTVGIVLLLPPVYFLAARGIADPLRIALAAALMASAWNVRPALDCQSLQRKTSEAAA